MQGLGGHVFKLGGDGLAQVRQLCQAGRVVVPGLDVVVAHQAGWALRIGLQHGGKVAQALGGMHKHAAQLATAQHPQGCPLASSIGTARKKRAHG